MKSIIEIIKSIDSDTPNINPTQIYNEGWMTRLMVYYSIQDGITINGIDYSKIKNWCSEALLSSPIKPKVKEDKLGEGPTHTDMAIGDFTVNFENSGEIDVLLDAKIFGVIEAKMKSNLSQGTKYAKEYNQASRNLACIAKKTCESENCEIFFAVVAPEKTILKHKIENQIKLEKIIEQINIRFTNYQKKCGEIENMNKIIEKAEKSKTWCISYEDWICKFEKHESKNVLNSFYNKATKWNKTDNQ
jgi:hypothetical protein